MSYCLTRHYYVLPLSYLNSLVFVKAIVYIKVHICSFNTLHSLSVIVEVVGIVSLSLSSQTLLLLLIQSLLRYKQSLTKT